MKQVRKRWVFLIGFSGSGKSSVGRELAERIGCRFDDLDSLIEKHTGRTIPEIFEKSGEVTFRKLEANVFRKLLGRGKVGVVALGGGAFESEIIRTWIKSHGVTVFLSCSVRELYRRLKDSENRPLLRVAPQAGRTVREAKIDRTRCLLAKRLSNYRAADVTFSTTTRTVVQTARELSKMLEKMK